METMVVSVRYTDVLLLPLAHFDNMVCTCLYMKAGTSKALKYIPVHVTRWMLGANGHANYIHAVTGCDSVSQFGGHGKKTAWKVLQKHHADLAGCGKGLSLKTK